MPQPLQHIHVKFISIERETEKHMKYTHCIECNNCNLRYKADGKMLISNWKRRNDDDGFLYSISHSLQPKCSPSFLALPPPPSRWFLCNFNQRVNCASRFFFFYHFRLLYKLIRWPFYIIGFFFSVYVILPSSVPQFAHS